MLEDKEVKEHVEPAPCCLGSKLTSLVVYHLLKGATSLFTIQNLYCTEGKFHDVT